MCNGKNRRLVSGGGGFPTTPDFTLNTYLERGAAELNRLGIHICNESIDQKWLLLTDKRSKLREVFHLEASTVIYDETHASFRAPRTKSRN